MSSPLRFPMSLKSPLNIPKLLEHLAARDPKIDQAHQHALRRALLCSSYFERPSSVWWVRVVQTSMPLLAGGAVVTAIAITFQLSPWRGGSDASSIVASEEQSTQVVQIAEVPAVEEVPQEHAELATQPLFLPMVVPVADFMNELRTRTMLTH